jgi:hypothetical protein
VPVIRAFTRVLLGSIAGASSITATVPAGHKWVLRAVSVANTGIAANNCRVAVAPSGGAFTNVYAEAVASNGGFDRSLRHALGAGDQVRVLSTTAGGTLEAAVTVLDLTL